MTYEDILRDLNNKIYHSVYLLYGEEPYFIDKISDYIQQNILDEGEKGFNLHVLYGKDVNPQQVADLCKSYPMMGNYQVIILKEAQTMKGDGNKNNGVEKLEAYMKAPLKSTILVVNFKYGKFDGRTKFWKETGSKQAGFESKKIYDDKLPAFIKEMVSIYNHKIDNNAVLTLADYLGNDLSKIENEVEKLTINVPKTETINTQHIEKFIGISKEYNVYELQKALAVKDTQRAYSIVDYYIKNPKENPFVLVIGTLNGFFTKAIQYLACGNDANAKKALYLNFFQEQDMKNYQKHFTNEQTEKIFDILLEYDLKSKGVGYNNDKEPLLKELVFKILNA
jgi:DNA polymerase-3 subunit delta